jgi:putative effector of murein hydrolase
MESLPSDEVNITRSVHETEWDIGVTVVIILLTLWVVYYTGYNEDARDIARGITASATVVFLLGVFRRRHLYQRLEKIKSS